MFVNEKSLLRIICAAGSIENADEHAQAVDAHLLPASLLGGSTLMGTSHLFWIVLWAAAVAQMDWHAGVFSAWCAKLFQQLRLLICEVLQFLACNQQENEREREREMLIKLINFN